MQLLWTSDAYSCKAGSKVNLAIEEKEVDPEADSEHAAPEKRPTMFINTVLVSISLCAIVTTLGLGFRQILIEIMVERT